MNERTNNRGARGEIGRKIVMNVERRNEVSEKVLGRKEKKLKDSYHYYYRVIRQVVRYLLLTSKQTFHHSTGWGGHLFQSLCKLFSESSPGPWAALQLPCCPSKQGELLENILQNLWNKWPPHPVWLLY